MYTQTSSGIIQTLSAVLCSYANCALLEDLLLKINVDNMAANATTR